jgi:hypothetical protein
MRRIIKRGTEQKLVHFVYRAECPVCGCVFEFDEAGAWPNTSVLASKSRETWCPTTNCTSQRLTGYRTDEGQCSPSS